MFDITINDDDSNLQQDFMAVCIFEKIVCTSVFYVVWLCFYNRICSLQRRQQLSLGK